jgi:hypothetical protein
MLPLKLKQLREENTKLKRLVADLTLDKVMLQDIVKKVLKPAKQREVMHYLMGRYGVGERRAAPSDCASELVGPLPRVAHPVRSPSSSMRPLMVRAARVAPLDSTVLITGESGVGKDPPISMSVISLPLFRRPASHDPCAALPPQSLAPAGALVGSSACRTRTARRD